ncbi:hypothetical protein GN958_ATG02281 [Phytophthora infestans]|uniref:Uncharacterized protein n=1 Tax=Phytophthora infestans TaxID=4787 RepID=A0A8S9V5Z2_PHYIN|nr:hypothetical protein GN958_ATG02281 [Phytophthora infestans]
MAKVYVFGARSTAWRCSVGDVRARSVHRDQLPSREQELVLRGGEPGARVLDNGDLEFLEDMIVVVDGQTRATWPIRSKSGANILPESIDQCKGYSAFAVLLDSLNVDQPDGGDGSDLGSSVSAGDAGMLVGSAESHLKDYLNSNADKMSRSLAVSKVVVNAKEIEFDSLAKDGAISIYATRQARPRTLWRRPVQQLCTWARSSS